MAERDVQDDLKYTKQHEWVRVEGETATVGITDFAQQALGEVTYIELPEPGTEVEQGKELAVVESLKAASDVYAPASGTVASVNPDLEDQPDLINTDPYGAGWLCTIEGVGESELGRLLSSGQYRELLNQEES